MMCQSQRTFEFERFFRQGVKSASQPFQGCIKDIELDGRAIGLPDVLETLDIRAGCVWEYPCTAGPGPCPAGETCSQDGLSGFRCSCPAPPCGHSNSSLSSPTETPGLLPPLSKCFLIL